MGKVSTGWIDYGTHLRVYADIPLRANGLPNHAAREAAEKLLATLTPAAYDPPEPVPEIVARAAQRDFRWEGASGRRYVTKLEAVANGEQMIRPLRIEETGAEEIVMTEHSPPVPVFEEDEMPGPRCQSGVCLGD